MPTEAEFNQFMQDVHNQQTADQIRMQQGQLSQAATMFSQGNPPDENLIRWQLDIKEELRRIERLLREQIPGFDKDGNEIWLDIPIEERTFSEYGINKMMGILNWYLTKNLLLSNYDPKEIELRVYQIGHILNNYIYNNYEDLGLDNLSKRKNYPLVLLNLVNSIEAAYKRAMFGEERRLTKESRIVTQNEQIGMNNRVNLPGQQRGFNLLNPRTWG